MEKSLGLVEVIGLSSAVEVADAMAKAANVILQKLEITRGKGMVTVKVQGDVGAVTAAVTAGTAVAQEYGALVTYHIIPRPLTSAGKLFMAPKGSSEDENKVPPAALPVEETKVPPVTEVDNTEKIEKVVEQMEVAPRKIIKNKGRKNKR